MAIIETHVFTRRLQKILSAEEYRLLQRELIIRPFDGKRISGSGGLRKLRWSYGGKGKSGGVRVIYYWDQEKDVILLLLIYSKNEQDDLSGEQLRILRKIVEGEYK